MLSQLLRNIYAISWQTYGWRSLKQSLVKGEFCPHLYWKTRNNHQQTRIQSTKSCLGAALQPTDMVTWSNNKSQFYHLVIEHRHGKWMNMGPNQRDRDFASIDWEIWWAFPDLPDVRFMSCSGQVDFRDTKRMRSNTKMVAPNSPNARNKKGKWRDLLSCSCEQ